MLVVKNEVEIDAAPERVWAILADFESYPEWNTLAPSMKGSLVPGELLRGRLGLGSRLKVPFFPRLVTAEPNSELRWAGGVPGVLVADHRFLLEAIPGGGTRVSHHEEFSGLMPAVGRGVTEQVTNRLHSRFNGALKRRAESTV
ncbi:MAG: SRPBCC domain-containing protein [Solirubrobacterales bacterium]